VIDGRKHVKQGIVSSDLSRLFIWNLYFYTSASP